MQTQIIEQAAIKATSNQSGKINAKRCYIDLDVLADVQVMVALANISDELDSAPEALLSAVDPLFLLMSEGHDLPTCDASKEAVTFAGIGLSLASQINTKTFDADMFYLTQARLKPLDDMFVEGLCDIHELRNFYPPRKGHSILCKGVRMIRRVGAFFC